MQEMANKLLTKRGASKVGKNWLGNFVRRTESLTTQFNRLYNLQRALCEDPKTISNQFKLIQRTKAIYGILDKDTYNFNKAGFIMGKISSQLVITSLERRGWLKVVQLGNYKQVIVIGGVNAIGQAIPPFIILIGLYHLSAWYKDKTIPRNQELAVSDNGQTINKLGLSQLRHFIKHTESRVVGARQLLILDGHKSHKSLKFRELCQENNIYTLYIPSHLLHLLQPLNISCFSPLKRVYRHEINSLIYNHINYITKLEFLPAFKAAYTQVFTTENIRASF